MRNPSENTFPPVLLEHGSIFLKCSWHISIFTSGADVVERLEEPFRTVCFDCR